MPWNCPSCAHDNLEAAHFCAGCGAPNPHEPAPAGGDPQAAEPTTPPMPPFPEAPAPKGGSTAKWWIFGGLAVLLAFCCIVGGIIAAIAIPNLLNAKERGNQKRAMSEIKTLGDALGAYAVDTGGTYPDTGHEEGMYYTTVDVERLAEFLVPKYIAALPAEDPWKKPYQYGVSPENDSFILICGGKDGQSKLEAVPEEPLETHCYEDDILWERDRFLQSPGGQQKSCK